MIGDKLTIWSEGDGCYAKYENTVYSHRAVELESNGIGHHHFKRVKGKIPPNKPKHILFFFDRGFYMAFGFSELPELPCSINECQDYVVKTWKPDEIHASDGLISELSEICISEENES